jgi:hypothetical protein
VSADFPLDMHEGVFGDEVLCLELPEEAFEAYEMGQPGRPYREALFPAEELNRYSVELWSGPRICKLVCVKGKKMRSNELEPLRHGQQTYGNPS